MAWRWWELFPLLCLGLGLFLFVKTPWALYGFPLDDAWIHQVYARSFAWGNGFEYNPGIQEAGSSSPLWSILTAPVHWFDNYGINTVVILIKAIGVLCGVVFLFSSQLIARTLTSSRVAGVFATSLIAVDPRLLFSMLSGMETILLVALWISAVAAGIFKRNWLALFLFSLMPVTRPETLLILPLAMLLFWPAERTEGYPWKQWFKAGAVLLIPMGLWSLFCLAVNGHPLPNTFYLKATTLSLGGEELTNAWKLTTQHGWASVPLFLLGWLGLFWLLFRSRKRTTAILLGGFLLAPFVLLLGVVATRIMYLIGYYWARWLDPSTHMFTVASIIGFTWLCFAWLSQQKKTPLQRKGLPVLAGIALIGLIWCAKPWVETWKQRSLQLYADARVISLVNVRVALWLKENTSPDAVIGVNDAGATRYFSERKVLDFIGLNNKQFAFKEITRNDMAREADWIAAFPHVFQRWGSDSNLRAFRPVQEIGIPRREYSLCPCPGHERVVLFQRKIRR